MSEQAPKIQTPENQPIPSAEVAAAFEGAKTYIYNLSGDPSFHTACAQQNLDPFTAMDQPAYWDTAAGHAQNSIGKVREARGDSLRMSIIELATATPSFLFRQNALDQNKYDSKHAKDKDLEIASYYNSLVRDFGAKYPGAPVSEVVAGLQGMALLALEDPVMKSLASRHIKQTVRGAQHELGFGQILARTGLSYDTTSVSEDLRGADFIVEGERGPLMLDVKASLSDIEKHGVSDKSYARLRNGRVVMYSLLRDHEFNDTFAISEATAEEKAPVLRKFIHESESINAATA